MDDTQNAIDTRNLPIDQVGVNNLRYPIVVLDRENARQQTVAQVTMSVDLPHQFRGTHMSRFLEVLNEHNGEVTMRTLPRILQALRERLGAARANIELTFPYFLRRYAPVTGASGLMDYQCTFIGRVDEQGDDFILVVRVPVNSLCPCSKAISDYGAHNQRGYVTMQVRSTRAEDGTPRFIWIEDLVAVAEQCASAPVYPILKRADERHVTMLAYDNPAFVEDVVRSVALRLQADLRVAWFRVEAVHEESIHNHSAFARICWARKENGEGG